MRVIILFALLLCADTLPASAQWVVLGTDEDSLIARIGKPDSSDNRFDYFLARLGAIKGKLMIVTGSMNNIIQSRWNSDSVPDNKVSLIYSRIDSMIGSANSDAFHTFGDPDRFQIWYSTDSIVSLIKGKNRIYTCRLLRASYYYLDENFEPIEDTFFSVNESAYPLDYESTQIAKVWRTFLELPPWDLTKYSLWSRYDSLMDPYFTVPRCPDYYSLGYRAKLVGIVKDPELNAYIVSTVFSPVDSTDARFLPWKKTSRQITYFIQEDGNWKITSALPFVTKGWKRKHQKSGAIYYHFPSTHTFNKQKALEAQNFVDSISSMFGVFAPARIDYYYAFGGSDIFSLLGLDVSVSQKGILLDAKSIILLRDTNECFLHELVHAALSTTPRAPVITEGIAEFISGDTSENNPQIEAAAELIQHSKNFTVRDIWNLYEQDTASCLIYATGLIFFQKIVEHGGMKDVVAFYKACTSEPEFEKAVKRYLNVLPADIDAYWRVELEKAYKKLNPANQK